jgi:hypothetical protein
MPAPPPDAQSPSEAPAPAYQPAPSQPPPPPPPPAPTHSKPFHERSGFLIGLGLGAGNLQFTAEPSENEETFGSVFMEAHFGGFVNPRLALILELWGSTHALDPDIYQYEASVNQTNVHAGAQYWFTPRMWLKAAFGTSRLEVSGCPDSLPFPCGPPDLQGTRKGFGGFGALGYEVLHRPGYSLDLQLRLAGAGFKDDGGRTASGSFNFAFTWY